MSSLSDPTTLATGHPKWGEPATKPEPKPRGGPKPAHRPAAVLPGMEQRADLSALLACYAADPAFCAALILLSDRLLAKHGTATAAASDWWGSAGLRRQPRYAEALRIFLSKWKLDRLPAVDGEPAGRQALDQWLTTRFLLHAAGEWLTADEADAMAGGFGGGVLYVADAPHVPVWDAKGKLVPFAGTRATAPRPPRKTIVIPDAATETEASLLAELRRQREAIKAEHEEAGYRFPDAAHRRDQHAGWLYRRLVGGLSYRAIANEWNKNREHKEQRDEEAIKQAVHDFARRLGVTNLSID